jgi:hypothetical protein
LAEDSESDVELFSSAAEQVRSYSRTMKAKVHKDGKDNQVPKNKNVMLNEVVLETLVVGAGDDSSVIH